MLALKKLSIQSKRPGTVVLFSDVRRQDLYETRPFFVRHSREGGNPEQIEWLSLTQFNALWIQNKYPEWEQDVNPVLLPRGDGGCGMPRRRSRGALVVSASLIRAGLCPPGSRRLDRIPGECERVLSTLG
jgi:hypothetical protein